MQCLFNLIAMPRKVHACRWLVMASISPQGRYLQVRAYDIKQLSDSSTTCFPELWALDMGRDSGRVGGQGERHDI